MRRWLRIGLASRVISACALLWGFKAGTLNHGEFEANQVKELERDWASLVAAAFEDQAVKLLGSPQRLRRRTSQYCEGVLQHVVLP